MRIRQPIWAMGFKTKEEIMPEIERVSKEINKFRNILENEDYYRNQLDTDRRALDMLIKNLENLGEEYKPVTQKERKTVHLNEALENISKLTFDVTTYLLPYKVEIEVDGEDAIYRFYKFSDVEQEERVEDGKEELIEVLKDLYMGEWRKHYEPKEYWTDGMWWDLTIEFDSDEPKFKVSGYNQLPYNFDELNNLFDENLESYKKRWEI